MDDPNDISCPRINVLGKFPKSRRLWHVSPLIAGASPANLKLSQNGVMSGLATSHPEPVG